MKYHPCDGRAKRAELCRALRIDHRDYHGFIVKMYEDGMSGQEISEYIERETGISITPRSIQRSVQKHGKSRTLGEAFKNAVDRGRVRWQYEEMKARTENARKQLNRKLRYEILKRDGNKCVLCGARELLQIDHITAKVNGGTDDPANLRTLCIDCNIGKALSEGERRTVCKLQSGKEF